MPERRGLAAAVETLTARAPLPVHAGVPDERYPEAVEVAAYFLVAETLTNVAKHAEATEAWVEVTHEPGSLVAESPPGRGTRVRARLPI